MLARSISCLSSIILIAAVSFAARKPEPRPAVPQQLMAPFWTLEPGWHTTFEIRNNLGQRSISVAPSLLSADGTTIQLAPVVLRPDEVRSVDLRDAVANVAPRLMYGHTSYGSIVFRYSAAGFSSIYAAVMVHRDGQPIEFHFDAQPIGKSTAGSRESIWWLPRDTSQEILVAANVGPKPVVAQVTLTAANGRLIYSRPLTLGPRQTRKLSVLEVLGKSTDGRYGGVKLSLQQEANYVYLWNLEFDDVTGQSALLKVFDRVDDASDQITLRAPMVALSNPDSALNLPEGTRLQPLIFLRNTSAIPLDVDMRLNCRTGTSRGIVQLPLIHLAPLETRVIDVGDMQKRGIVPEEAHWAVVSASFKGIEGDLVAISASFDLSSHLGLQSPFSSGLAGVWKGGEWRVDETHNSLIAAGNGGTTAAKLSIKLFFGSGAYELPERDLLPGEQAWVNVGDLIHQQIPDKFGVVLPPDLQFGSYEILDLNDPDVGYLFEGKLVTDKSFGHATYGCAACCATYSTWMGPNPWSDFLGNTSVDDVYAEDCAGYVRNKTGASYSWSTSNSSVITIPNLGSLYGRGAGSANVNSYVNLRREGVNTCPLQTWSQGAAAQVQRPTSSRIVSTFSSVANICPSGQAGWYRKVRKRVTDQVGKDIVKDGQYIEEITSMSAVNDLGLSSPQTGAATTAAGGYFDDIYAFCTSRCPASPGETDAVQQLLDTPPNSSTRYTLVGINLVFKCTGITANGQ